jgi:hypothetical protein
MLRPVPFRVAVLAGLALALGACAMFTPPVDQRTPHGPSADEFFVMRSIEANGRHPSFEERRHWEDHIDDQIGRYLREHPRAASDLNVSNFKFFRRSTVGMTKDQITILLGPPLASTTEPAEIEKLARRFAPQIKARAKEAWMYPLGWNFYFAEDRVVDITQYLEP